MPRPITETHRTTLTVVLLFFSFFWVWYAISPLYDGGFGVIDDHVLLRYLGQRWYKTFSDFVRNLPEVYRWSVVNPGNRHTPSYAFVRAFELFLFNSHYSLWITARIFFHSITIFLLFLNSVSFFGLIPGLFFSTVILVLPAWGPVFGQLVSTEAFACLGTMCFCFAANRIYKRNLKPAFLELCLLILGFCLAIGSKESFYFLGLYLILFVWTLFRRRALSLREVVFYFLAIAFNLVCILVTVWQVSRTGADYYQKKITWMSLLSIFTDAKTVSLILGLVLASSCNRSLRRNELLVPITLLSILYQLIVFRQFPDLNHRYGIPFFPLIVLAFSLIIHSNGKSVTVRRWVLIPLMALFFFSSQRLNERTDRYARRTGSFSKAMDQASIKLRTSSEAHVVFERYEGASPEFFESIRINLKFRGVRNRVFDRKLPETIALTPCYSIRLAGSPPGSACKEIALITH